MTIPTREEVLAELHSLRLDMEACDDQFSPGERAAFLIRVDALAERVRPVGRQDVTALIEAVQRELEGKCLDS